MSVHQSGCTCAQCGTQLQGRVLDYGFRLPDPIFEVPPEERSRRNSADFAELGDRRFVRGLLPLKIIDTEEEFRFGLWFELDPDAFTDVITAWSEPKAYMRLEVDAWIANRVPSWPQNTMGEEVTIKARSETERLFVVKARSKWLRELLSVGWTSEGYQSFLDAVRP